MTFRASIKQSNEGTLCESLLTSSSFRSLGRSSLSLRWLIQCSINRVLSCSVGRETVLARKAPQRKSFSCIPRFQKQTDVKPQAQESRERDQRRFSFIVMENQVWTRLRKGFVLRAISPCHQAKLTANRVPSAPVSTRTKSPSIARAKSRESARPRPVPSLRVVAAKGLNRLSFAF